MRECYPESIVLIIGNHELMNLMYDFSYTNPQSLRTVNERNYINSKLSKFRMFYIEDSNLFVHGSVCDINLLSSCQSALEKNMNSAKLLMTTNYSQLFNRQAPTINDLNKNGINNIFSGHTGEPEIRIVNNGRVYYLDVHISHSFGIKTKSYYIISIENRKMIKFQINRIIMSQLINEELNDLEIKTLIDKFLGTNM